MNESISVVLLAGGKGMRMGTSLPKQFLSLKGKPIACHSLEIFLSHPNVKEVVVVCDPSYYSYFSAYPVRFALPGERRQDSLWNGMHALSENAKWVCVHDAARPFISHEMLSRLIQEGINTGAATVGMPSKVTVKISSEKNFVEQTLDRRFVWEIQTPQLVAKSLLLQGFELANRQNTTVTDDVSLAELVGHPVKLVLGSYENLKITTPEDLVISESLVNKNHA